MSLCTWGVYPFYWAYQNWKRIGEATSERLSPFWRATFAQFWCFSFFRRVRARAAEEGLAVGWGPDLLGATYMLGVQLSVFLPLPWSLLLLFASIVPLLPVLSTVAAVNARHASIEGPNSSYSFKNIAGIFLGCGLAVFLVLGTLMLGPLPDVSLADAWEALAGGARSSNAASLGDETANPVNVLQDPVACTREANSYAGQGEVRRAAELLARCIRAHPGTFMQMGQKGRIAAEIQRACDLGLDEACRIVSGNR